VSQPSSPVPLLLLLLAGAAAGAQPQPVRARTVTLSGNPAEPVPVVRVGWGLMTVIRFDTNLDRASVQWDRAGFTDVEVGDRAIFLSPTEQLAPGQQWRLRARYLDGARPQWVELGILVDPESVDTQLTVTRLRQPEADCPEVRAQPCEPCTGVDAAAALWAFADRAGRYGVQAEPLRMRSDTAGLRGAGRAYRTGAGLLLVADVRNKADSMPWTPKRATVMREERQEALSVRTLAVEKGALAPGSQGRFVVDVEFPVTEAGGKFTLNLHGEDGRVLTLEGDIPAAPKEVGNQ
jgi:uncharacterized protein (TIGR02268 family)